MDNQKTERVELHLHTGASEDTSVITPKDAIETAVKMGHKAVAITCLNSVQDFAEMERCQWKDGNGIKVIFGAEIKYVLPGDNLPEHITVLAKDKAGLRALYQLISSLEDNGIMFVVSKELLEKNRKHLLLGSHHFYGELYRAVRDGAPEQQIKELAAFYDYIELYTRSDDISKEVNRKLYYLGKRLGIPVVAVGNCHYIEPEDQICKKVIDHIRSGIIESGSSHFRTTEEMLKEFSYLGEEAAYEVVVTNTNKIADQIDYICPFSGQYPPFALPNASEEIKRICKEKLHLLYGKNLPLLVAERLETELEMMEKANHVSICLLIHHIVKHLHKSGGCTGSRGAFGSTLVAHLLEISDTNPLPAHYSCPMCKHAEFIPDAISGYDLPQKACPYCGADMHGEGHNIPYETYLGIAVGDLSPDVEINIPWPLREHALQFLADYLGAHRVARAGALSTISRLAEAYVTEYQNETNKNFDEAEEKRIIEKIGVIKRDEWNHPGGFMLLPEGMEFCDVTPVTKLEKPECGIYQRTHIPCYDVQHALPKVNILCHRDYNLLSELYRLTGTTPDDIQYNDPELYVMIRDLDTLGFGEFSTSFAKDLIRRIQPKNFSDLVRISGISHGTNTWCDNGEYLLREHPFRELIGDRDDIFRTLQKYGVDRETAYCVMTAVCKGRFHLDNERNRKWTALLEQAGVPDWYIASMKKIRYLFPKAHATAYTKLAVSLAWFKHYYPEQFYRAVLKDMGAEKYFRCSDEELELQLDDLEEADGSHDAEWDAIRLLLEARQRGFAFKSSSN